MKNPFDLHKPIGIFDAGIGSYAIVERVRTHFPRQDIVYFADRASFPYGSKTPAGLLASVKQATEYLISEGCVAIILASNAPSIVVLNELQSSVSAPVIGVFPPVREAITCSRNKHVAVLGVHSMVTSQAMQIHAEHHRLPGSQVTLINASPLVELVESFDFLNHPAQVQEKVSRFIASVRHDHPTVDVMTMSSTHLPWLEKFFIKAAPDVQFLDPANTVLEQLQPYASIGQGQARFIATETPELTLEQFNAALRLLGAQQQAELLNR